MKLGFAIALAAILIQGVIIAAPWPPVKAPKISGTVVAFTWVGGFHHQQEEVWPVVNPTGVSEFSPTYFLLLNKTNLTKKQRKEITEYSQNTNFRPKIFSRHLEKDEVIVMIRSPRLKEMVIGAKIGLTDYDIRADEFTSWSKHAALMVDGKKPTKGRQDGEDEVEPDKKPAEQDGTEQPATAPESKPESDSKPQPESKGRSQ